MGAAEVTEAGFTYRGDLSPLRPLVFSTTEREPEGTVETKVETEESGETAELFGLQTQPWKSRTLGLRGTALDLEETEGTTEMEVAGMQGTEEHSTFEASCSSKRR